MALDGEPAHQDTDVKSRKLWLERIEADGDATIVLFCKLARV